MKLTLHLVAAVTAAIMLVLAINATVRVKRESAMFERDIHRDSMLLAQTLAGTASRIWATVGELEARDVVTDADLRKEWVEIEWHRLSERTPRLDDAVRNALMAGLEQVMIRPEPDDGHDRYHSSLVPVVVDGKRVAAYDFVPKPFEIEALVVALERAIQMRALKHEVKRLREAVESRDQSDLIGESDAMRGIYRLIDRISVERLGADLPARIEDHVSNRLVLAGDDPEELVPMSEIERRYIERVLDAHAGNKTAAARVLGFDRTTLYRKLERYGLDR
jgi:hypothetical protein